MYISQIRSFEYEFVAAFDVASLLIHVYLSLKQGDVFTSVFRHLVRINPLEMLKKTKRK
jgi:hypothetical protein